MADTAKKWYARTEDGKVYGPADFASLVQWAEEGRITAASTLSSDLTHWTGARYCPEFAFEWLVEFDSGKTYGPFNRKLVSRLVSENRIPETVRLYRLHVLPVDQDAPIAVQERRVEVPVEKIVEKTVEVPVEKIVRVEVPVDRVVEKTVEVPVEKVVEKIVRVEVPVDRVVEKIVEVPVEKVVEKIVRVEVPVDRVVEKIVEVPVEKIVEKIVRVEVPATLHSGSELVVPEVVDAVPEASKPVQDVTKPAVSSSKLFGDLDHERMAALEAAARQELLRSRRFGMSGNLFGRKG